jgi:large repetitive protein
MSRYLRIIVLPLFLLAGCGGSIKPTISSFTPASAPVGATVIITGTNFDSTPASNTVTFNGIAAVVASCTSTQIVATVPQGATSGPITVTTTEVLQGATSAVSFTVVPPPSISGITPASAPVGSIITITGTNFDPTPGNNAVTFFNGISAVITSGTSTQIVVTAPAGSTTGPITVTVDGVNSAVSGTSFGPL